MTRTTLLAGICLTLSLTATAIAPSGPEQEPDSPAISEASKQRAAELVSKMTLEEKLSYIGGIDGFYIREIPRLGIPRIRMADGPQGVRNDTKSTMYPCGIAAAATWNRELAYAYGKSLGTDARARGVHIMLGPGVNIYRFPKCGRNFEYYGEDPYLVAELGTEMARGIQSQGVASTLKHYAVYSVPKGGRDGDCRTDPHVAPRELHQLYLYPFRRVVREARPMGVMSSYNDWDGVPATRSCSSTSPTASAASRPTSRSCADSSASASSPGRRVASPSA